MPMSYTQVEISRAVIRDALIAYLRANRGRLVLPQPREKSPDPAREWFDATRQIGMSVIELAGEVYRIVVASDTTRQTVVSVSSSGVMNAFEAYLPVQNELIILEEILDLVHTGVLMQVKLSPQRPGAYDFVFSCDTDRVLLTIFGQQVLDEDRIQPYFTESYLSGLHQIEKLDPTLEGYLSEGLVCLRNHLTRAAAILLRTAAEYTLELLIQSTLASLKPAEQQKFKSDIRNAGTNIEKRGEAVLRKLESSAVLLPRGSNALGKVRCRLRAAFHSIRDLGGTAAHLASPIQPAEVTDHYTLYASSVYPIVVEIIQHHRTLQP
jgi:hypothetical protein